jgi:hypothetical protein
MKKKILIVSLLLLAGTAVAVFAAGRCTSQRLITNARNKREWVQCERSAGHGTSVYHQAKDSTYYVRTWSD